MAMTKEISERISQMPDGEIFFVGDFADICNEKAVSRILSALEDKGTILRLARGIYCKAVQTQFGPVYPSVNKIVNAVAQRDHAQVLPSGATAANLLGMSTQVPMSYTYITSGSARQLTIGEKSINFLRSVPRNFAYQTTLAALIVQALKSIGKDNLGAEEESALRKAISAEPDKEAFRSDVYMMPQWMKRYVSQLI